MSDEDNKGVKNEREKSSRHKEASDINYLEDNSQDFMIDIIEQKRIEYWKKKLHKKIKKEESLKDATELFKVKRKNKEFFLIDRKNFNLCFDDRIIPVYMIRNFINTHQLSKAIKLFSSIVSDSRSCPFFICKTGNLLLKNYLKANPKKSKEIFEKILNFNNIIKHFSQYPTYEIIIDFLTMGFELGYIDEIKDFFDSSKINYLKKCKTEKEVNLCYNSFESFYKFYDFFQNLKRDNFDIDLYLKEYSKKQELQHVILSLKNLLIGFLSRNCDYPLDYFLINLIDILILFKKRKQAKEVLIEYYKKNPQNLNTVIYILKFNELFLNDESFFNFFYEKLENLDPSNVNLINYLDHLNDFKKIKILMNFVDYIQNKENKSIWKILSENLDNLNDEDKLKIKEVYKKKFESYWSNYHFSFKAIKIDNENCDYVYNKAKVFLFFDKEKSLQYVKIISFILKSANSDKFNLLNNLANTI